MALSSTYIYQFGQKINTLVKYCFLGKEIEERLKDDDIADEITDEDQEYLDEIFDPQEKLYDDRKRRVTDLKECNKITLPKALPAKDEALIEMRREVISKIYKDYRDKNCKKDQQESNLTENERKGLESLQKRIRDKEIVVMKTDKSGKFAVTTMEIYIEMGSVHTKKDRMISRAELIEIEKQLNGHATYWCKMWGTGGAHDHMSRVISSKVTRSENMASMYVMYKDHKEDGSSRPVVTGHSSNTRGFSNSVSDFLESVADSVTEPYEVVSSEDMLSRAMKYNQEVRKIRREGIDKRMRKIRCTECGDDQEGTLYRCHQMSEPTSKQDQHERLTDHPGKDESGSGGEADAGTGRCNTCHPVKDLRDRMNLEMKESDATEDPITLEKDLNDEIFETALECTDCADKIRKKLFSTCDACGEQWVREDFQMSLIGNDVVALFPSIKSRTTGIIIRMEAEKSPIKVEGFEFEKGLKYIVMNKKYTGNLKTIANLIPWRKKVGGVQPGMKNKNVNRKVEKEETLWIYPKAIPTKVQEKQIIARVAEIGTRVLFENFCYTFAGNTYIQMSGGPIGARVTMAAARIVMQAWSVKYQDILIKSGLRVPSAILCWSC